MVGKVTALEPVPFNESNFIRVLCTLVIVNKDIILSGYLREAPTAFDAHVRFVERWAKLTMPAVSAPR